jgi:hypothetical protein
MDELVEIAEKIIGDGVAEDRSSRSIARQVLAAISSSTTHRVVPVEPTQEMSNEGWDTACAMVVEYGFVIGGETKVWEAMLAASPKVTGNE